jgi:hypothetical protein
MRESDTAGLFAVRVDDEEWREARSLSEAGPEDNVFVVDRSTGQECGRCAPEDERHQYAILNRRCRSCLQSSGPKHSRLLTGYC